MRSLLKNDSAKEMGIDLLTKKLPVENDLDVIPQVTPVLVFVPDVRPLKKRHMVLDDAVENPLRLTCVGFHVSSLSLL